MKKIVLQSLASDIIHLIDDRAKNERIDRRAAIIEILHDAAIERAVQHDIELLDSWLEDDEVERVPNCSHVCSRIEGCL